MKDPQVLIVTPCLNPGLSLERCLDSVASQSYAAIEHVVIDGGSTDGTVELLSNQSRVKWISEKDAGQAEAINKGCNVGKGDVLGWLNADDTLTKGSVSQTVETMQRNDAGWAYGNVTVVEGEMARTWTPPSDPGPHLFKMGKGGVIPQPGSLITREAWDRVGGLDPSFHLAMDFDLWLRLIDAGIPHAYVPHTLATFNIHPSSKTGELGLGPFFVEEARALLKSDRAHHAALALGRAAAQAWCSSGGSKIRELERHLEQLQNALGSRDRIDPRVVWAAARAEAALVDRSAWKLLLHPSPWTVRETRRRIVEGILKFVLS